MIIELAPNQNFTLTTGYKQSKLRCLRNDVPLRAVLAHLFFNLYTYYLVSTICKKFAYPNLCDMLHFSQNWKELKGILHNHTFTFFPDFKDETRLLKTVTAAFHFSKREAKPERKIYNTMNFLLFCSIPTYVAVKLDKSLTFRHCFVEKISSKLRKKYLPASRCCPIFGYLTAAYTSQRTCSTYE